MWTGEFINVVEQTVAALSVICFVFLIRAWWNWQTAGRRFRTIPSKGTLGWPIVGETFSISRCIGDRDFTYEKWLKERIQKYGTMFKSHLFLKPWIVVTTLEETKFVLDDPHKQLVSGAPKSLVRILGRSSIFAIEGKEHREVYKILNDSVLMSELKKKTADFNSLMRHSLSSWDGQTVEIWGDMQRVIFKIMTLKFFGIPWDSEIADGTAPLLQTASQGLTCVPINFPGTVFYKAINARLKLEQILLPIIRELRSSESGGSSKYADSSEDFPYQEVLNYEMNGEKISDVGVCDILLSPILTGSHGPSTVIGLTIYHLTNNPSVLEKAQAEVDRIRKRKEELGEIDISVSDLKDLKYLTQVYNEVLRISTVVPGTARIAKTDIHYNGYVIPKGWSVLTPFVLAHMDPKLYPEPTKFDPDRFETPPNPGKFFPFGRGYRSCVGRDFTKLVVLMALYHIISNFTWDAVSCSGKFTYFPVVNMTGGYHFSMKSRTNRSPPAEVTRRKKARETPEQASCAGPSEPPSSRPKKGVKRGVPKKPVDPDKIEGQYLIEFEVIPDPDRHIRWGYVNWYGRGSAFEALHNRDLMAVGLGLALELPIHRPHLDPHDDPEQRLDFADFMAHSLHREVFAVQAHLKDDKPERYMETFVAIPLTWILIHLERITGEECDALPAAPADPSEAMPDYCLEPTIKEGPQDLSRGDGYEGLPPHILIGPSGVHNMGGDRVEAVHPRNNLDKHVKLKGFRKLHDHGICLRDVLFVDTSPERNSRNHPYSGMHPKTVDAFPSASIAVEWLARFTDWLTTWTENVLPTVDLVRAYWRHEDGHCRAHFGVARLLGGDASAR
ncbi:hypothetical protein R1sor_005757 [Riccia sorocarpa]|uniref:Cytochrome P450 n=1 Tax=Riccia sorocarpa TaxID=122646 RepID=A0ABD3HMU2_9MARC